MNKKQFVLSLLFFLLMSCDGSLDESSYQAYLQKPENGLIQMHNTGQVVVTCMYRPHNLLVAHEISDIQTPTQNVVDSVRKALDGRVYFSLSLAQNGMELENRYLPNQQAFTQAVTYLNTGIAQDIYLVTSGNQPDSITALTAIYPRQYGSTGRSTVLLVFDTRRLDLSYGFTLSYHDTQFGLGTLRFPFSAKALANLPKLKFQ